MKQLLLVICILTGLNTFSQTINYQATARDSSGDVLINTNIGVQFTIHETTPTGTVIYTETHNTTTSAYGLFNLPLGGGSTTGDFTTINWSATHFLETAIDVNGGTSYTSIGTSEFRAVPYAIYAGSSPADADSDPANEVNTDLSLTNTTLSITDSAGTLDVDLATLQDGVGITSGTASNMQPYTAIKYYIATSGTFPFKNAPSKVLNDPHYIPTSQAISTSPYLSEIMPFAGVVVPNGWAECNGQLLPINSNTALFSIIGTTYGGDGESTFALPDLRGRTPIHYGNGPGLTNRPLGQKSGSETVD